MPAKNLFKRLKEKTSNRVLQMDCVNPPECNPAAGPAKAAWKKIGIKPRITDISVDNVVASQPIDQYAPSEFYVETLFNQGFFNTTGSHVFKLRTLGKNAASSAFTLSAALR